jgi:hypothetical protein
MNIRYLRTNFFHPFVFIITNTNIHEITQNINYNTRAHNTQPPPFFTVRGGNQVEDVRSVPGLATHC